MPIRTDAKNKYAINQRLQVFDARVASSAMYGDWAGIKSTLYDFIFIQKNGTLPEGKK
jgi:hypothetical protein